MGGVAKTDRTLGGCYAANPHQDTTLQEYQVDPSAGVQFLQPSIIAPLVDVVKLAWVRSASALVSSKNNASTSLNYRLSEPMKSVCATNSRIRVLPESFSQVRLAMFFPPFC